MHQKLPTCFIFILLALPVFSQPKDKIEIGEKRTLYSNILKETREFWIYTPSSMKYDKLGKYPVLYLFDGDGHLHSVSGVIQALTEINGNTVIPEMIVVGIKNTNRTRDLTPTHSSGPKGMSGPFYQSSGGGNNFTSFLKKELIPFIDKNYPTTPYRTLIGHSLGGLQAIDIFLEHPEMFNSFISIDPSLWWDDQVVVKKAKEILNAKKFPKNRIFISMANNMKAGMDTSRVRVDTTEIPTTSILKFADLLKRRKSNELTWKFSYYKDDTHTSVPLISTYDGLRFIFDYYDLPLANFYTSDFSGDVDSIFTQHYSIISKNLGYTVLPPEFTINQLGSMYLRSNKADKAYACFALNIRNYPKSSNAYDGMGDFYRDSKNVSKAIEFYSKALAIQENKDIREKLNRLKGNASK